MMTLVQAIRFGCQILIFAHKLREFVSACGKASGEFRYCFACCG